MATIFYRVLEHLPDLVYSVETDAPARSSFAAEDAAEDFHANHGGFGCAWPLIFVIQEGPAGPELGRYEVDCEHVPAFVAMPKRKP